MGYSQCNLGCLPRTPCAEVTFPYSFGKPPSYGDIPAPATAAELLHRIEEIEATVWRLMSTEWQEQVDHHYGPLRRTYGFFEANTLLASREAGRFGVKKPGSGLTAFS